MKEQDIKQFVGMNIEAVVMESRIVIRGILKGVENGFAKFSSIEDIFVLVHGKRLSMKLMLSGSFTDLEALLNKLSFPCSIFDKCRVLKMGS
ncbi:MAG: hypothetical protein HYW01_14280 [Deltaproteobacteria bacterium]|nr:hypothetical protein [Deltaproteobacteria bacterium]